MNRFANYRDRDDRGRFISDDEDDRRYGSSHNRNSEYRDERGRFHGSSSQGSGDSDYRANSRSDDEYRQPRGGQYGDILRADYDQGGYRDSRYDDDERSQGGWFGDSRRHAGAAREGWENRR